MNQIDTNRIERSIVLHVPPARVWRALTDVEEFNTWFRVALTGSFAPGARLTGPITYEGYEHLAMDITIDRMEHERLLSWRWHPGGEEEPQTQVTFELKEVDGSTLLTVVESGFDALPPARRDEAYRGNEEGWAEQMKNIERHLGDVA